MRKNLSILNFKLPGGFLLCCLFIIISDLTVTGLAPKCYFDNRSTLFFYLWRGYSVVRRLKIETFGEHRERYKKILEGGWPGRFSKPTVNIASGPREDRIVVTFFGQSFTKGVAAALSRVNPKMQVLMFGAGGTPISWCYDTYRSVRGKRPAHIRVIGLHTTELPQLSCLTGSMISPTNPSFYTFPRYKAEGDRLSIIRPVIDSPDKARQMLTDRALLGAFTNQLKKEDRFYDPVSFQENIFDRSFFARSIKYQIVYMKSEAIKNNIWAEYRDEDSGSTKALKMIFRAFAHDCYEENALPVLLLFTIPEHREKIAGTIRNIAEEENVRVIDTSSIVDINDSSNYDQSPFHFTRKCNRKIAETLNLLICAYMNGKMDSIFY